MQGDVTRIMEMSDFERRKIIDEIAGVSEFDHKKTQSLSQLDVVRERVEREAAGPPRAGQAGERAEVVTDARAGYEKWQNDLTFYQNCRAAAQSHAGCPAGRRSATSPAPGER